MTATEPMRAIRLSQAEKDVIVPRALKELPDNAYLFVRDGPAAEDMDLAVQEMRRLGWFHVPALEGAVASAFFGCVSATPSDTLLWCLNIYGDAIVVLDEEVAAAYVWNGDSFDQYIHWTNTAPPAWSESGYDSVAAPTERGPRPEDAFMPAPVPVALKPRRDERDAWAEFQTAVQSFEQSSFRPTADTAAGADHMIDRLLTLIPTRLASLNIPEGDRVAAQIASSCVYVARDLIQRYMGSESYEVDLDDKHLLEALDSLHNIAVEIAYWTGYH